MSRGCRIGRQWPKNRQYAAAKVNNSTGSWMPVDQGVNDLLRSSAPQVRARVRQMVRDFPFFARAVNILSAYTVGRGLRYQAQIRDKDGLQRDLNQKLEDHWSWWAEEADITGKLHFSEIEDLCQRQDCETGEFLLVKVQARSSKRHLPFALQVIEGDWLTDTYATPTGKNIVDQGIEYDRFSGEPIAYHVSDPENIHRARRIPAEYVLHHYKHHRPGQHRGISPFTPGVLLANSLNDYIGATVDTAKMAAKYLAIVTTPNPAGFQAGRGVEEGDDGQKIEHLENALVEYLRPGEEINFANPQTVNSQFDPFTKFVLRVTAISTGTTYEMLSGDYSGLSYSSLKGIRNDFYAMTDPRRDRFVRHLNRPVLREFMDSLYLSGKLDMPGYVKNPRAWCRSTWMQPERPSNDPLRDSKADGNDLDRCLTSPQRIAARRGIDIEEVLDEIKEFNDLCEARGITPEQASTAMANNPAALGADGDGRSAALLSQLEDNELLNESNT